MDKPLVAAISPGAAAQARYRAKNAEVEKEKAKLRMRRLRAHKAECKSDIPPDEFSLLKLLPEAIRDMTNEELWATADFQEFTEYCNKVKVVTLTCDPEDPQEVADFKAFMETNPCVEDLPPYDEEGVQWVYWCHFVYGKHPEWREELADYRDFIAELTPEELDKRQWEARMASGKRHTLRARGGF